jgi:plasmid replication initiation protein
MGSEPTFSTEIVPVNGRRVYQHNVLAEARYRLTIRAQKLLAKLISELNPNAEDFPEVRLTLDDFAPFVVKERNDLTFAHFCDTAQQLFGRFLAIQMPLVPGEKHRRTLICHWISSAVQNPNDKSITFTFDKKLHPYLLGLKRDFFVSPLIFLQNFESTYSVRLYQLLKSRAFYRRPQTLGVDDVRFALGTIEYDGKGNVLRESLNRYADFKRVALMPAIKEINAKTDLLISFKEIKRAGTKIVEQLVFSTHYKEASSEVEVLPLKPDPQIDMNFDSQHPEEQAPTPETIGQAFGLTRKQMTEVAEFIRNKGLPYVLDKVALTNSKERDNAATFFLVALREDYKWPVKVPKPAKPGRAARKEPLAPNSEEAAPAEPYRNPALAEDLARWFGSRPATDQREFIESVLASAGSTVEREFYTRAVGKVFRQGKVSAHLPVLASLAAKAGFKRLEAPAISEPTV